MTTLTDGLSGPCRVNGAVLPITDFADRFYLTYPHANGFAAHDGCGGRMILGQRRAGGHALHVHDLRTRERRLLGEWRGAGSPDGMLWFDVPVDAGALLVAVADNTVWRISLEDSRSEAVALYREPAESGHLLMHLPSVSRDGSRVVVGRRMAEGGACDVLSIDMDTGEPERLVTLFGEANHFHLCPGDEAWLAYCREGPAEAVGERVWGWHATDAPRGRPLFDNGAHGLCMGHERWAFHTASAFVVAYGVSPRGPRGVYELFPDGRPARLVSAGDRDWHVAASRDGRWLAVDTTGPHDEPGRGWENAGRISDILVIDTATGRRRFVARSRWIAEFHCHPHPVFSPDGRTLFFNEGAPSGAGHRVVAAANPWTNTANDSAQMPPVLR